MRVMVPDSENSYKPVEIQPRPVLMNRPGLDLCCYL